MNEFMKIQILCYSLTKVTPLAFDFIDFVSIHRVSRAKLRKIAEEIYGSLFKNASQQDSCLWIASQEELLYSRKLIQILNFFLKIFRKIDFIK